MVGPSQRMRSLNLMHSSAELTLLSTRAEKTHHAASRMAEGSYSGEENCLPEDARKGSPELEDNSISPILNDGRWKSQK